MSTTRDTKDDLIEQLIAMLDDIEAGYPLRELHINLEQGKARALELGVSLQNVTEE